MMCPTCQVPCSVPVVLGSPNGPQETVMVCPSCNQPPDSIRHAASAGICLDCGGRGWMPSGRWTEEGFIEYRRPCPCGGRRIQAMAEPPEYAFDAEAAAVARARLLGGLIGE